MKTIKSPKKKRGITKMKTFITVRDFDGEMHPYVTDLNGLRVEFDSTREYPLLATCVSTGINVISLDDTNDHMRLIQSIDCNYRTEEA